MQTIAEIEARAGGRADHRHLIGWTVLLLVWWKRAILWCSGAHLEGEMECGRKVGRV